MPSCRASRLDARCRIHSPFTCPNTTCPLVAFISHSRRVFFDISSLTSKVLACDRRSRRRKSSSSATVKGLDFCTAFHRSSPPPLIQASNLTPNKRCPSTGLDRALRIHFVLSEALRNKVHLLTRIATAHLHLAEQGLEWPSDVPNKSERKSFDMCLSYDLFHCT